MPCGARRAVPCTIGLRLVGWTTPRSATHVVCHGYPRSYPPQLVPERLVFTVQCHLGLVRAGVNKAEQSDSWFDQHNESPSSCGP